MKKIILAIAVCAVSTVLPHSALAQKKAMDHDVYDSWQSVSGTLMTPDGNVLVYQVNPQQGDGNLFVRKSIPATRKQKAQVLSLTVPRGYMPSLDPEGKWLYARIKPEYAKTRQEKIDKKKKDDMTKDSVAVVDLSSMQVKKFPGAESFSTGFSSRPYVAYKTSWKGKDGKKKLSGIVVYDPGTGQADSLAGVDKFAFSVDGKMLAMTAKKDKKDKKDSLSISGVMIADLPFGKIDTLCTGAEFYGTPVFSDGGGVMAFTASKDTNATGSKRCSMSLVRIGKTYASASDRKKDRPSGHEYSLKEIFPQGHEVEKTDKWTLTETSKIFFSKDGKRLFTGIAPLTPPKDTTIVDFETAQLDIWNWDAPYTPPQQLKSIERLRNKTYMSVIDLESPSKKLVPLTTSFFDEILLPDGGESDVAVSLDEGKYARSYVWTYDSSVDVDLVSLKDGSRTPVARKLNGSVRVSPAGKYLYWYDYDDLGWHTYDIASGKSVNLTGSLGTNFHDEEDDHPSPADPYDRNPRWLEGDKSLLVSDRYDVWKLSPDGSSAVNLTDGSGRRNHLVFRTADPVPFRLTQNQSSLQVRKALSEKEPLCLSVRNEDDQRRGVGKISLSRPGTPEYFLDTLTFYSVIKAESAPVVAFQKGNFRNCYDLYLTRDWFASEEKVTAVNPQKDDYRWGRAELFQWKAYDGTPLKGLVFIPDGVKDTDKLPVMVYFYEKYSEDLYAFRTPAPSRSTVNITFYTSRGYICFIPDIVYKVGHPGQSAYNCICSGAEALCAKYPFADKSKMAIQGQSWGGYQTAWLVTHTDMFAAAGAGAPVSNMTSAYGGIRWESGITRAGQYERGQSRIGKSLWEEGGLDLYIENSPAFFADKVNTPLLIMHNDADGAVPWYQGIEYFSDLRRLDKRVWMLQYNNEAHNLIERKNCLDLSRRLQQFFDHYLKGEPMPAWLKYGVPATRKGEYFGFEPAG